MANLKIKRGDTVKVISGSFKGKTGKVVAVNPASATVAVEGLNVVKRHVKPSMVSPQGGIVDVHKHLDVSKVAIVQPGSKTNKTSRVGFIIDKSGVKKRVYKQLNNKEIDV